ncbi:diguanylate cyclase [Planctomycetaceae bacterium SH139]
MTPDMLSISETSVNFSKLSSPLAEVESEIDATVKQAANAPLDENTNNQSCLVQIYPPDIVDGMVLIEQAVLQLGRDIQVDMVLADASVSRHHAEICKTENGYKIRDLDSTNGTLVNGHPVREQLLNSGDTIRIGSFLFRFLSAGSIESQYHETVYGALTRDALTGTFNKRYLLDAMNRELSRAMRQQAPLSLMMLDIDHFKQTNDTHGHLAGDEVLREFATRIMSALREDDMLARFGGEEFCILLCGTDQSEALEIAERCRLALVTQPFATSVGPLAISASFGVACLDHALEPSAVELIEQADQLLYRAKESGRNRVCGPQTH